MKRLFTSRGIVFVVLIFSVFVLMSSPLFAQPPDSLCHHHHFPPFWGSLTDDQRAEVRDTVEAMRARGATREEIHDAVAALLESWGIEIPPPPDSLGHHHHFPPFWGSLTDDQRAEVRDTVEAMRSRGATREEIHDAVAALLESWGIEIPPPPDTSKTDNATSDIKNENSKIYEFSTKNYPNPFNSETSIEYTIGTDEQVNIAIYDASGKCISTLLDGKQKAGTHIIKWNGRDKMGNQMPSGKYFYRVNAGSKSITQGILLLE